MGNNKYAVLKLSDWNRVRRALWASGNSLAAEMDRIVLPDAEVIRHQDITSAPIFYHYASGIQSLIELGTTTGIELDYENLRAIADHFHKAAMEAENHPHKKIPT